MNRQITKLAVVLMAAYFVLFVQLNLIQLVPSPPVVPYLLRLVALCPPQMKLPAANTFH